MLTKGVNKEGLKAALQQVWRTFKEVKIESVGNNIFMFKFAEEVDKKRVLKGGPWHFDRPLIVLAEPKGIGEVAKQSFTHTSFLVQIRNVPLACMDKDFLWDLGRKIGSVEEVQTDDNGDCIGEYARIRVSINITQPLERILFLKQEGETDIPMPVVYERLLDFCYFCGIIGHQYKECGKYQDQPRADLPYGSWMKAITVGGFTKRNQNKGRWNYGAGKSYEKSASSENHSFQQQQGQNQENSIEANGSVPSEKEMGQTMEQAKNDVIGGVAEQQLMQEVIQSADKEQNDGHKQAEKSGNATAPRKMGTQAGNGIPKEREKMQMSHEEEAGKNDGPEVSQLQPNKRKWKRLIRELSEGGELSKTSVGVGTAGAGRGGSHGSKQYGDIGGGWWPASPEAMNILSWNVRGRIAMLWKSDIGVQINSYSQHHINAETQMPNGNRMRVTGVYGHPEISQKKHTWMLLRWLAVLSSSPWLCYGDFNEILHPDEKRGSNDRNVNLINEFREALRDCGLKDVGYRGYDFTWNNGIYGKGFVEERLDRFVCSKAWSDKSVDCKASNLDTWTSDHCPVLMVAQERREGMNQRGRHSSRIHYEDMWSSYDVCKEIIKEEWSLHRNWSSEDTVQSFRQATKASMGRLLGWSKLEFRKCDRKLEKLKNQLLELKQRRVQYVNGEEIWKVEKQIQNILLDEEIYWKQRSRAAEEVLEALSQMCPTKAPGPDGLPAVFYQKHWHSVKEGVLTTCLHILNSQEAFSSLLQQAEQQRLIHGLSFGNNLKISHLLFADDSLVFSRASMADCQNLKRILESYSTVSGQIFNLEKSSLFLSGNVQQDQAEAIENLFQLNIVSRHEKYLGLPSMIWRKRSSFFNDIKLKPSTFQPVVKPSLPPDAMVLDLINEANCWDEKRINEHFDKMDADLITKIPLPRRPKEDELIWHYGKNGQFSVKWNARNQLIFKGKRETPQIMVAKAEAMIAAYKRVHSPAEAHSETEQRVPPQTWNPLQDGFVKVNINAAISFEKNIVGLGAIIKDVLGHVTAAAIKVSKFHGDVSYAEAEAMEWGMLVARDAQVKAVIVESDSQGVVNLVNNKQGSRSEIYWVVSEIQKLVENFECVSIKYTPRSCNVIAHSLAKLALEKCETIV
ncbi:hypothetical protein KPL70_025411 [Citrus sinensis]|nr:hypothetical protein KPL70_025411 [Citrus sinensis]